MTQTLLTIVGILFVVSAVARFSKRYMLGETYRELKARLSFWWGMLFVFSLTLWVHPYISVVTLGFLCFFALKEFYSLVDVSPKERRLFFWSYLTIPLQFYWILTDWYGMFIIFIPIHIFLIIPLIRILALQETKGFLKAVSTTHWGLMLMVFGLSHLAYYSIMQPEYGPNLVLYLVFLTQFADTVQFLASKLIGKRPVVLEANPHVTWEGTAVSFLLTTVAALIVGPSITPMTLLSSLASGGLIALATFVGTLNLSCVKRDLKSGEEHKENERPESPLRRIDSLSYSAPLFLHFIRYVFEWI